MGFNSCNELYVSIFIYVWNHDTEYQMFLPPHLASVWSSLSLQSEYMKKC